ncbi:acylamino-acid-releasing enzyme-like [Vicia villosa]|uniref:acylamino-acid-releasing enzyme-like n=1 Tax=Vicia villosa TaxID=3911 RepID=UPI00273CC4B4|nr:acylamino-acid-releasing enzyme-like [Vicia villosa]XP_058788388.1 acylamino-acid-releasing enzyme-like [Vicia villosa]XP_058788389.1 acylamino-acid-releasing enzyme-like [Vicia villosa]
MDFQIRLRGMMFSVSQPNLQANKKRKLILSSTVTKLSDGSVNLQWAPFPVEVSGVSAMVPSPSSSKLWINRNPESDGPSRFEFWSNSYLEREFHVPQSKHGSVYTDGWTCSIYVVKVPHESKTNENEIHSSENAQELNLTQTISSAFLPRFRYPKIQPYRYPSYCHNSIICVWVGWCIGLRNSLFCFRIHGTTI